jgi:hypothetical protein
MRIGDNGIALSPKTNKMTRFLDKNHSKTQKIKFKKSA